MELDILLSVLGVGLWNVDFAIGSDVMVKRSDVAKIELECVECIESYLCLYRMCVSITNDRNH